MGICSSHKFVYLSRKTDLPHHLRRSRRSLRFTPTLLLPATQLPPQSAQPPLSLNLQHNVREEAIHNRTDAERHETHLGIHVEFVQVEDFFAGRDRTLAIDLLPVFACEFEVAEGVDGHVSDGPFHG
jgi:hypothetical protein